jgi:hypothetical protein
MRKFLLGTAAVSSAALAAGGILWPSEARAVPIPSISIAIGASPTQVFGPATGGLAGWSGTNGALSYNISATGSPLTAQPVFDTTSTNVSTSTAGVAYVWITEQNLSSPLGINKFLSGFTSNTWSGAVVSVTENTLVSAGNALFGGTLLATQTFSSELQSVSTTTLTPSLSSPYSETVEYIITFGGIAIANDTIDMSSIPEPVSLALFGTSLIGLGLARRRRV